MFHSGKILVLQIYS